MLGYAQHERPIYDTATRSSVAAADGDLLADYPLPCVILALCQPGSGRALPSIIAVRH